MPHCLPTFEHRLYRIGLALCMSAALAWPQRSLAQDTGEAPASPDASPMTRAPIDLAALAGNWQLVGVLGSSADHAAAAPSDIDWPSATAHFHVMFETPTELHARFVGPPLSAAGAVAGGSLMLDDPSRGTLKLKSEQPTPVTKLLRELDAGLLPQAFVVGEQKGDAQYVYVRSDIDAADDVAQLLQRASERAALPVAASRLSP